MKRFACLGLAFCAVLVLVESLSLSFLEKGTMPNGGKAHMATVVIGSKIYFFGGANTSSVATGLGTQEAFTYDTSTNEWANITAFTARRYGMCGATDGESIWIFGGFDDDDGQNSNYRGTYFPSNDTWAFASLPFYTFKCSATYVPETKRVLLVYGMGPSRLYDPATEQFEDLTFTPYLYDYAAGSVWYNNLLWLSGSGPSPTIFRTVTGDGKTWGLKANNTNGLSFADLVQFGDVMLTFGGNEFSNEFYPGFSRISMYNITKDEWSVPNAELPLPLNGVSVVLVGPSIYLFGGLYEANNVIANDKYWMVPCVDPTACEYGCDDTTGQCMPQPPMSPPVESPVQSPVQSPVGSPVKSQTPQTKTSIAGMNKLALVSIVVASIVLAVLY